PRKIRPRGGSLGEATADPHRLLAWLVRNLERLVEELEYHAVRAGHLQVWVGYRDGQPGAGEGPLVVPSDRFGLLLEAAKGGLRQAWRAGRPAQRIATLG